MIAKSILTFPENTKSTTHEGWCFWFRAEPHGAVSYTGSTHYSAVRPERSIPSTRYLCPNRYRMTSGAIMQRPQVFLIAA